MKKVKKPCAFDGCISLNNRKGYCERHYKQIFLGIISSRICKKDLKKNCEVKGCIEIRCCKQMCSKHYQKMKKYGDPLFRPEKKGQTKGLSKINPDILKIQMRKDERYKLTEDERQVIGSIFYEQVGSNECENVFCVE